MLGMNEIRKGQAIVLEGQPYLVVEAHFLKKQQRRPVVRSKLKHLRTGNLKEHTFMQSDKIAEAQITKRTWQFLYVSDGTYVFMDQETYEQFELSEEVVGEMKVYLLEGQTVMVVMFDGSPVSVELPIKIDRKVIEAPPGVRGDTSNNVTKEATIEGGLKLKVPLFIHEGDMIKIDTRTGQYLERA